MKTHSPPLKWGYIDRDGETVIPFQFDHAEPHSEGRAVVASGGKKGCVDTTGNWVIPPSFDSLGGFRGGLAAAGRDDKEGYIDQTGHYVIQPTFQSAYLFHGGLARVKIDGRFGYIDRSGDWVIPPCFQFAGDFADGRALVANPKDYDQKWYIDREGRNVLGPFKAAEDFSDGWAAIQDADACYFIDAEGNTILRLPPGIYASRFVDDVAAAEDFTKNTARTKRGYINRSGGWVIPPQFDSAGTFRNGAAVVEVDDKYGLIGRNGRYIVPPEFRHLGDLAEGRVLFTRTGQYGYLDHAGRVVIEGVYHLAQQYSAGLAPVCQRQDEW